MRVIKWARLTGNNDNDTHTGRRTGLEKSSSREVLPLASFWGFKFTSVMSKNDMSRVVESITMYELLSIGHVDHFVE